jgi:hypothetical protein
MPTSLRRPLHVPAPQSAHGLAVLLRHLRLGLQPEPLGHLVKGPGLLGELGGEGGEQLAAVSARGS